MANDANAVKYRRLKIGEVIEAGDEYQSEETKIWTRVPTAVVGSVIESDHLPHRRLCLCGAQQPQHCDLTEQVALLWASLGGILGRVVRLEGEMGAVHAEAEEAAPACDPASPAEGMRTERVTLEVTHDYLCPAAEWVLEAVQERFEGPTESVRVVEDTTIGSGDVFADVACGSTDDEVVRLTAERDAAIKECARLRDVVRQLSVKQFVQPQETSRARVVDEGDESSVESMKCVAELERERDAALAVRDGLTAERDAARAEAEWLRLSLAACAVIADCNTPESLDRHRQVRVEYDCAAVQAVIAAVEREIALRARVAELERERDAARAECERLRTENALLWQAIGLATTAVPHLEIKADDPVGIVACVVSRVAELEAAAGAGGEAKQCSVSCQGIPRDGCNYLATCGTVCIKCGEIHRRPTVAQWLAVANAGGVPPEPRGWLTAEEADAVDHAADIIEDMEDDDGNSLKKKADALRAILARPSSEPRGWLTKNERTAVKSAHNYFAGTERDFLAAALCGLLARETPPRVKVPQRSVNYPHQRDAEWIAAIREAGGEVDDG